jgi:hypothetical protein
MKCGGIVDRGRPAAIGGKGGLAGRSVVFAEVEHRVGTPNGAARDSIRGGKRMPVCQIAQLRTPHGAAVERR